MKSKEKSLTYYEKKADNKDKFYLSLNYVKKTQMIEAHFHKSLEIISVISGEVSVCINGIKQNLRAGQISIVNAYDVHYYKYKAKSELILIILGEEVICDFISSYPKAEFYNFLTDTEKNKAIYSIIELWLNDCCFSNTLKNRGYSLLLFNSIIENYGMIKEKESDESNNLLKMISYIEEKYLEEITLDDLAQHLGYSKSYCSKLFNKTTGEHFCNYINNYRIDMAKKMLDNDKYKDKTILNIAMDCGFNSINSFYRSYKRIYGVFPRRQNSTETNQTKE